LAVSCALLAGCETARRTAWQMGVPGVAATFQVDSVRHRVGFLDARLSSAGVTRRIFAPGDSEACRKMLVEGQSVEWSRTQPYGPLWKDSERCEVVGLGDLEAWRGSRGRASTTTRPLTSARTRYTIVHRDEEYLYARGGFSLIGLIGWRPGTDQVIALLPRTEVCAEADRDGLATTEFRIAGTPAFSVVTRQGLCPISGVLPAPRTGADEPIVPDEPLEEGGAAP
jgi:hypothetical protein